MGRARHTGRWAIATAAGGLVALAFAVVFLGLPFALAAPVAAAVWAVAAVRCRSLGLAPVLAVAIVLHGVFLFADAHSNDVVRYLWEGHVQLAGHSPYASPPNAPELETLRDDRYAQVAFPELTTVYPPLAQASFAAAAALDWSERGYRDAVIVLHLVLAGLVGLWLARSGRAVGRTAWLAWSPVAVAAAATGHVDVLMALALVGFAWAWEAGRFRIAAACLGLAVLAKTVAVLLVPWALWRRPRALLLCALPIIGIGWLPFVAQGGLLGSLPHFAQAFAFNGSLHPWIEALAGDATFAVVAVLLVAWVGTIALRCEDATEASVLTLTGLLLLAPTVHYWYLTWVLALLPALGAVWWRPPLLAWIASVALTAPLYARAAAGDATVPESLYRLLVGVEYAIPAVVAVIAGLAAWRVNASSEEAHAAVPPAALGARAR